MKLIVVSTLFIIFSCNAMEHANKINERAWQQDEEALKDFNNELLSPQCPIETIDEQLQILHNNLSNLEKDVNDMIINAPIKQLDQHMIRLRKVKQIHTALSRIRCRRISEQIQKIKLSDNNGE